jgi:hypothetical protein
MQLRPREFGALQDSSSSWAPGAGLRLPAGVKAGARSARPIAAALSRRLSKMSFNAERHDEESCALPPPAEGADRSLDEAALVVHCDWHSAHHDVRVESDEAEASCAPPLAWAIRPSSSVSRASS